MIPENPGQAALPDAVRSVISDFATQLGAHIQVREAAEGVAGPVIFRAGPDQETESGAVDSADPDSEPSVVRRFTPPEGPGLVLEFRGGDGVVGVAADLALHAVERAFEFSQEIEFFTR